MPAPACSSECWTVTGAKSFGGTPVRQPRAENSYEQSGFGLKWRLGFTEKEKVLRVKTLTPVAPRHRRFNLFA
jgi:hypothetical protein